MFNPAELRKHLDTLTYDKYYQDIEILNFEGYSKSFETWDRIQSLGIDWRNKSVCDLGCFHGYFSFKVEQMGADTILGLDQGVEVLEFSNKLKVLSSSKVEFSVWRGGQTTPNCDIALVLNMLHHCADQRETLVNINCEYAVFEVNTEQIPLISEYFDILKQTQGRIGGSGFRSILYAIKKRE